MIQQPEKEFAYIVEVINDQLEELKRLRQELVDAYRNLQNIDRLCEQIRDVSENTIEFAKRLTDPDTFDQIGLIDLEKILLK